MTTASTMRKRNACGTSGSANDGPRRASAGSETSSAVRTRAHAGARETLAAEDDDGRERDEHQQRAGGEGAARGRRRDQPR